MKVGIVDYGMGNVRSVFNAFEFLDCHVSRLADPKQLASVDRIVLPGVGAFGDGIGHLKTGGWIEELELEVRQKQKPFLGVCLGMQLLATEGSEYGRHQGLGWIAGEVLRLQPEECGLKIPHMGWNDVVPSGNSRLYGEIPPPAAFYFTHSYHFKPEDSALVSGWFDYGGQFAASVEMGNIFATQFHPEKSQKTGLKLLKNFLSL